jgi:hypothetical protein
MVPALSVSTQLGLREATATPGFGITRGREGEERTDACAHSQLVRLAAANPRCDGMGSLDSSGVHAAAPRQLAPEAAGAVPPRLLLSSTQLRALQRTVRSILGKKYRKCSVYKVRFNIKMR